MSNETRAAIRPVKNRVEDDLISRSGVNGVDIGVKVTNGQPTGELSIVVFVEKKQAASRLAKGALIPKEIDGIPTDVQEVTFELQPAWAAVDATAQVDTTAYTTLAGGISIGPSRTFYLTPPEVPTAGNYTMAGTLGAMVRDNATGATMALTNFHVAAVDTSWAPGQRLTQPSRPDGGNPATGEFGSLTRAVLSDHVDGAVVTVDSGRAWQATVTGIGGVAGTAAAVLGQHVRKRGRTTELTEGTVQSLDFTVSIDYGDGLGTRTLRNQIRIDPVNAAVRFSDHGDSGSVIMNDSREVVGLLFGGATNGSMTFANPIAAVLSELNVTMLTDQIVVVPSRLLCPTLPAFCRPTLLTCPSVIRICPTLSVACRPTLFTCPSRGIPCPTVAVCPTRVCPTVAVCPTRVCPSLAGCPSLACGVGPQQPGNQQGAVESDYGYGEPEAMAGLDGTYEAGFNDGYASGFADGQAGAEEGAQAAAQQLPAGVDQPAMPLYPTAYYGCPPPTTRICPTWALCPSIRICPTRWCPTRRGCPSLTVCPTRACPSAGFCGPWNPGGPVETGGASGMPEPTGVDSAYWAGYLAALEQYGGDTGQ